MDKVWVIPRCISAAVLVALVCSGSASGAENLTSASGAAGAAEIVYGGSTNLCAITPQGTNPRELVWTHGNPAYVGFSNDARFIGYIDEADEGIDAKSHLETSTVGGGSARLLWSFVGSPGAAPAWSPSDSMLALTVGADIDRGGAVFHDSVKSGLWVVPTKSGAKPRLLTTHASGTVAWSPNGQRIAYVSGLTAPVDIETIAATGGVPRLVMSFSTESLVQLSWSSSNRIIVDVGQQGGSTRAMVESVDPNGSNATVLLTSTPQETYNGALLSPNSTGLVVNVVNSQTDTTEIANGNGAGLHQLGPTPIRWMPLAWLKRQMPWPKATSDRCLS